MHLCITDSLVVTASEKLAETASEMAATARSAAIFFNSSAFASGSTIVQHHEAARPQSAAAATDFKNAPAHRPRSVTWTIPNSCFAVMSSPLLASTFSMAMLFGRTSAINSSSPASRASVMRWRIKRTPMPRP